MEGEEEARYASCNTQTGVGFPYRCYHPIMYDLQEKEKPNYICPASISITIRCVKRSRAVDSATRPSCCKHAKLSMACSHGGCVLHEVDLFGEVTRSEERGVEGTRWSSRKPPPQRFEEAAVSTKRLRLAQRVSRKPNICGLLGKPARGPH